MKPSHPYVEVPCANECGRVAETYWHPRMTEEQATELRARKIVCRACRLQDDPTPAGHLKLIAERARMLVGFYRSEGYDAGNVHHWRAVRHEIVHLRRELAWLAYLREREEKDRAEWKAALDWCVSDAAETEADLLETLSRSLKRRPDEPLDDYVGRLQSERRRMKQMPERPTPATSGRATPPKKGRR